MNPVLYISWKKALSRYETGALAALIRWGLSDDDLRVLCRLHQELPELRSKIEDLLTDCNFHAECADWHDGIYEEE